MNMNQIRGFFPPTELPAFFEEALRFQAAGKSAEMRSYPYLLMLWFHDQFGIPRSQMSISAGGEVLLRPEAVKAMARKRLQEGNLAPDAQDAVCDLISLANKTARLRDSDK